MIHSGLQPMVVFLETPRLSEIPLVLVLTIRGEPQGFGSHSHTLRVPHSRSVPFIRFRFHTGTQAKALSRLCYAGLLCVLAKRRKARHAGVRVCVFVPLNCVYVRMCLCVGLPGHAVLTEGHSNLWSFLNATSPFL